MSPIVYIDNNSEEEGKNFIKFGEIKDKYDTKKKAVSKDFPKCFKLISDLYDCERLNSLEPGKFKEYGPCKTQFPLLDYCMFTSLCPLESKLLMGCTNNLIPDNETPLPLKCEEYYNSLGKCIQKNFDKLG